MNVKVFTRFLLQTRKNQGLLGKGLNDKILGQSKLETFTDDTINVTQKLKFVQVSAENGVGKGENAGHQHFLLLPQYFPNHSSPEY